MIDQSGVSGQCLIQAHCCILHPQVTVNILKDQLTELQAAKDALAISRTREDTLQNEVGPPCEGMSLQETLYLIL